MTTPKPPSGASAAAPAAPRRHPLAPLVPLGLEVGAWLLLLTTGAIAFGLAGIMGFFDTGLPADLHSVQPVWEVGEFSVRHGAIALTVLLVVAAAGLFLPTSLLGSRLSTTGGRVLSSSAAAAGVSGLFLFFFPSVWLAWLTGLLLAVMVALLVRQAPGVHRKPWRSVGVAAGLGLFVTYIAQIASGVSAGVPAQRWLLLLAFIVMLASAIASFLLPVTADSVDQTTGAFPAQHRGRGEAEIARPWACYVLFGALGVIVALPQIVVADLNFGQAGTYAILCAALVGWAAGFEAGPTFAPGMTRPRLTSFAVLIAGVLLVLIGALKELSGMAILSGAAAFVVGIGVRAQPYAFSRRIGFGIGAFVALLLTWLGTALNVPVTDFMVWEITTTEVAYIIPGLLTIAAGIIAIMTFSPLGVRGLGVDLVHAFRAPVTRSAPEAPVAGPEAVAGSEPGAVDAARRLPERGLFIAFEGGDGVGKTTQIRKLGEHLAARGFADIHTTREPGGTEAGQRIREVLLGGRGVAQRAEALLFAADRAHHIADRVDPWLADGGVVMTDRYIDSSLAYQSAGRQLSVAEVGAISRWATTGLVPHLTIILDMEPATANARTESRGGANHLDQAGLEFHSRVRQAFLDMAAREPQRYVVIDADRDPDAVAADIAAAVDRTLTAQGIRPQPPTVSQPPASGQQSADTQQPAPAAPEADAPASDEDATTVLPSASSGNGSHAAGKDDDDSATTVLTPQAGAEPDPGDAETTVMPRQQLHNSSRQKLQAQAEIERQARERLREARMRGMRRGDPQ
ncbi:dTMP kinase [Brevibacterium luteolum]|uniref:dTMP kinase n=1 Tax=Brevibacterium luteolum TaxID=199591 RepID=UPI0021AF1701|nr:dTMP kinase [Brevibacterium luteolum]MCT1874041.1 dTMP kinase [Brevibacterium luteolum]MCT1891655.1 dTMP kinase [Brevibacterium luteolum]MCT1893243.1 dTMP kinase [Brevibacterium luteolum]MCT1925046.1 dTMP kinase [Brevibacterium luteolum]